MERILIIEDDTALRENIAELLELSGYQTLTAANGTLGVDQALRHQPNLIVCDIMMPEMDGYQVLEVLSHDANTQHIPFIFLSARTEHAEIRKGMDLGADDYLTKPFEEEELLSAIRSRLAKAHLLEKMLKAPTEEGGEESELRSLHQLKNFFDDEGEIKTFKSGEAIYKEGDHSNNIFLILKGVVKTHKIEESGKELTTALFQEDDFLGFTSFFENAPYQESATAMQDVEVAAVSKKELRGILEHSNQVSLEFVELLAENLTEIKGQLLQMAYSSVRKKTAQTILQFAQVLRKKPEDPIRISRNDLAHVAGIATESLIRTLSAFKKEGLIEIEGRNIKLVDQKALEQID
ncbi:response regulator [Croceiramulus getboli]|nr:response regulator [Flavobacteriaceae bacterium YJPT1-3]